MDFDSLTDTELDAQLNSLRDRLSSVTATLQMIYLFVHKNLGRGKMLLTFCP